MSTLVSDTPQKHYQENGDENEVNFMLTPDMRPEIKSEPPEDINDTPQLHRLDKLGLQQAAYRMPNIRLTPTMKLLASPNPIDPKRKFSCPYENCTKSYGKSSHLRSHLTWHTGVKPYVCQEPNCGKSFTRSDELNRHSRTHTGEKPFECMQCGKKFSRSDHLTKHVATHTKQLQSQKRMRAPENFDKTAVTVGQQPEISEQKPEAYEQKPEVDEIGEPKSEIVEEKPQMFYQQLGTVNDDAPAAKIKNTKLTELTLPSQGLNYTDGMHFMASLLECAQFKHGRHVIEPENLTGEQLDPARLPIRIKLERPEHSDEYKIVNVGVKENEELEQQVVIKTEVEPPAETTKPPTEIATTTTPTVYNAATAHEDDNNGCNDGDDMDDDENTNDDTIMPEANAAPFPQAASLLAAPRLDHFERPYGCHQCIKSFKRQDDLNRHLRTHTGEKPYACTECEKRFMRSDHLKKHLKTHFKQL